MVKTRSHHKSSTDLLVTYHFSMTHPGCSGGAPGPSTDDHFVLIMVAKHVHPCNPLVSFSKFTVDFFYMCSLLFEYVFIHVKGQSKVSYKVRCASHWHVVQPAMILTRDFEFRSHDSDGIVYGASTVIFAQKIGDIYYFMVISKY